MTRALYQGLVWLHPPAFRTEFGGEMQWIFDQIFDEGSAVGVAALFADAVVSLLRQWIVRYGTWKIAAGFLGGIIHMWLVFACLMLRPPLPRILEPAEEALRGPVQAARVVNLANWSDENLTRLAPHEPEPTGAIIELEAKH